MFNQTTRRIAFVSPGWPATHTHNGIVTYVSNLCTGLDALGIENRILSAARAPSSEGNDAGVRRLAEYAAPSSFERFAMRVGRRISARMTQQHGRERELVRGVSRLAREWPFDLVEVEDSFGYANSLNEASVRTIVRLHGPWFLNAEALGMPRDEDFAFRDERERRGICGAFGVSSPSYDVLARVRVHYQVDLPDAEVIPNPCPRVPETARFRLAHSDRNQILFVGRFDRHKGGDIALEAFVHVARKVPDVRLTFVGPDRGLVGSDGSSISLPDYLYTQIPADVRGRVNVTGPLTPTQIAALRRRALLTVVPSRYETFGMTVVEAMAHGSPLVTSAAGGIAEIVRDGVTARVFDNGSPEALAGVLCDMLAHPEESAAMGARAQRDAELRFAPEVIARQMVDFYDRVRERRNPVPRTSGIRRRESLAPAITRSAKPLVSDGRRTI